MKLVVICGATATGKSNLSLNLARKLKCEIINFDSVQVYKELNIGTAKPSASELKEIPHHLIDIVKPSELFTAGDFRRRALDILSSLSTKYEHCILVGGTGFYLNALLNGMFPAPPSDELVKHKLMKELCGERGLGKLYEELQQRDPVAALKIHGNDSYRILRALEIMRSQGKSLTEIRKEFKAEKLPYEVIKIGLRREKGILREAILRRSEQMVDEGLVNEVRGLISKYGADLRPLSSVGYKETAQFLNGEISSVSELISRISMSTLQLAKRQTTWFKRDPEMRWFDPDKEDVFESSLAALELL